MNVNPCLDRKVVELPTASRGGGDERPASTLRTDGAVVAQCVDAPHPALSGRVHVQWTEPDGTIRGGWVPTLAHLPVRVGDRVLLLQPGNEGEPIVTGIVDGLRRRPEPERQAATALTVARDETVRIDGADGRPLLELFESEDGPVLRLRSDDLDLELPGRLRFRASRIELNADGGPVDVRASDDVFVRGEVVHLNP